jgi:hypothetical protein
LFCRSGTHPELVDDREFGDVVEDTLPTERNAKKRSYPFDEDGGPYRKKASMSAPLDSGLEDEVDEFCKTDQYNAQSTKLSYFFAVREEIEEMNLDPEADGECLQSRRLKC